MMSREHHRRRSPESSRRRRKERRDSREQLQSHPIPAPIPLYGDMYSQPHQQSSQSPYQQPFQDSYSVPYQSPYQPEPSLARDPERDRDRAHSSSFSSLSSSSSTSSSLLNISQPSRGFGLGSFFSFNARKQRRRVKKKRSKILRFGNSSSSSVGSDLAYGRGYIDRRRSSREFSPPARQRPPRRDSDQERPRPPRRAQTDEEIIELGRKFAELARQQNTDDLRAAGRTRPSTFASAATAINQFRRTNSGNVNKGIGSSKPHLDSSADDSDWESASSDDESSEGDSDNGLAYGSSHHLLSNSGRQSQSAASVRPAQTYAQGIPLNRKPSLVDPKLFGPINSLRGFVQTPCGFDRVDRNAVDDVWPYYEPPFAPGERVESAEGRPMQHVYPVPTSDPSRFDAGRGSIVSHQIPPTSRPDPVPIQQPKPIAPVTRKVLDSVDSDLKYSNRSSTKPPAPSGGIGLLDTANKAPLSSDAAIGALLRAARKSDQSRNQEPHSDDLQSRFERDSNKRHEGQEKYDDREVLRHIPLKKSAWKDSKATRNDEKFKRYQEQKEPDLDYDMRGESSRPGKYYLDLDRPAKAEQYENDFRGDQITSRREKRREKSGEDQSGMYAPKTNVAAASRGPAIERPKDAIDPFQYQVADDAFPTPRHGTPARPLTPVIMTVEREPDFSKFDNYDPYERLSRKDSFERELRDAQEAYKAAEQVTVPVSKAAFAAAAAAEIAARRLKRSSEIDASSRGHSQGSTASTRPKDPVLDDADRAYREARLARRIREQEERSRSNSPDSVVDKWKEEKGSANMNRIETPPAMDQPKQKSPFDGPNADVRIDNVLEHPRDLARFRVSESRRRSSTFPIFSARDPSAERERPMLNLVRPTPAPTPLPEKQKSRTIDLPSPTAEIEPPSVPFVEHDEMVSAPSVAPSKAVTWGENQTKHYIVETPDREDDPYSGTKIITPAVTSLSRNNKKSGWAAAATAAFGVGAGVTASSVYSHAMTTSATRDHVESEESGQSSKRNPLKLDSLYDEPPIPGPKPPSPRTAQTPGRFAEDPVFMANIAAGLEGSGFDPNIIIDDAKFHRRDSPPGSSEPLAASVASANRSIEDISNLAQEPKRRGTAGERQTWEDDRLLRETSSQQEAEPFIDNWADTSLTKRSKKSRKATVIQQDSPNDSGRDSQHGKAIEREQRPRDFDATQELIVQDLEQAVDDSATALQELSSPENDRKKKKKTPKRRSVADDPDVSTTASPHLSRESSYMVVEPEADPIIIPEDREKRVTWDEGDKTSEFSRRIPPSEDTIDSYNDPPGENTAATEEEWVDLPQKAKKKKKKSRRDAMARDESPPASQFLPRSKDSADAPEKSFTDRSFTNVTSRSIPFEADLEDQKEMKRAKRRSAPGGFPEFEAMNDYNLDDRDKEVSQVEDKQQSNNSGFFGRLRSSIGLNEGKEQSQMEKKETGSFLGSAGALGASAGLTGSAIALAYQKLTANAAGTTPEIESPGETGPSEPRSASPNEIELIDPEIVEREIRPAIDPTYGDLLPLPPSRSSSPVPDLDEAIPPLPESRPGTPEDERERLLLAQKSTHIRRRSETPLRVKTPSQSAIPIQFRLGQRTTPASPGVQKSSPSASPILATQETGSASRRPRPMSWESTRTFKPLLLVEKTSRESVVTPSSLHEELELSDVRDEPQHMSSPTPSHTVTPRNDLEDGRSPQGGSTQLPEESPQLPPLKPVEEPNTPTEHPEAVDSMSKNRSSYLLYSSPPGTQTSDDGDFFEGSPSLRPAKRYTTLEDVKEDTVDDLLESGLLMTAAGGLTTGALVANAFEDDYVTPLEAPLDSKDSMPVDVTDAGIFTDLSKTADTNETVAQDKEPSEVGPVAAKKTKKGKKGKNKTRQIEASAEASTVETPSESEVPLSNDTLEPAIKTEEQGDDTSSAKLSKKEKKKRKKEQSRSLLAESENSPESSLPVEEKASEPSLLAETEQIPESSLPVEDEKAPEPSLPVEEEKITEPSLPVKEEKAPESSWSAENETVPELLLPVEAEKDPEPPLPIGEEKTLEQSSPVRDEKNSEPSLPAEDEQLLESSLQVENEKTVEPLLPVGKDKTIEAGSPVEEEQITEPLLPVKADEDVEPPSLVENEKTLELSLPTEDKQDETSNATAEQIMAKPQVEEAGIHPIDENQIQHDAFEAPEWDDEPYWDEDNITPTVPDKKTDWAAVAAAAFGAGASAFLGRRANAPTKLVEGSVETPVDAPTGTLVETAIQPASSFPAETSTEISIEAPAGEIPVGKAFAEKGLINETVPVEEAPRSEALTEEAPVEEAPVDKARIEEVPAEALIDTPTIGTFGTPAEVQTDSTRATPVDVLTDVTVEPSTETPALEEPVVTTKKAKKKKKKGKSQYQEPEAEEQPALAASQGDGMADTEVPANNENAAADAPTSAHQEAVIKLEPAPATADSSASKEEEEKEKSSALSEVEAIVSTTPDAAVSTEPNSFDAGQDSIHTVEAATAEHVQLLPVDTEDALPKAEREASEAAPQSSSATEEMSPATANKAKKKKKKKKQSQVSGPELEVSTVADNQSLTRDAEEVKQGENELAPLKVPDGTGVAIEAMPSARTETVGGQRLSNASSEVVEPTPVVVSGNLDEQLDPALGLMLEPSQQLSDTVEPAMTGKPITEKEKLDAPEIGDNSAMQTGEQGSLSLQGRSMDASHLPEPSAADESRLKPVILLGEETLPAVESGDVAEDPLPQTMDEGLDAGSARSPEADDTSKNLPDTAGGSRVSPSDQLTGGEPAEPADESEEPRGKKKGKKNKKKKQSVSDSSDLQQTAPTLLEAEDVLGQPVENATGTDQRMEPIQTALDLGADMEPAEVSPSDTVPGAGSLNQEFKEMNRIAYGSKEPDADPTQQVDETASDIPGAVDSDKLAVTSLIELTGGESFSEPTTPTKKGKKWAKRNRQSADLSASVDNIDLPSVEAGIFAPESGADSTQLESESSLLTATEADLTTEKETTEAELAIDILPSKKKSKGDKKKRDSTELDLGSSSEIMPEKMDSSTAQQNTTAVPQPSEASNLVVGPAIDTSGATATEAVNNVEDILSSPKKLKKKQKRQLSGPAEDDDTSDLPGPIPESVSNLKEVPHIPEQVQEEDADISSASTITKKSKKEKKKKRHSVQFAEPIEESREMPAEGADRPTVPIDLPSDTSSQPTTSLESVSSPLDTTDSLHPGQDGRPVSELSESPLLSLDTSFVSLPADEGSGTSLHDVSSPSVLPSVQSEGDQNSEGERHYEVQHADKVLDPPLQSDVAAPVASESRGDTLTEESIESQPEVIGSEITPDALVQTDNLVLTDDQSPANVVPTIEDLVQATPDDEVPVVTNKSKKDKKKRKGKSQENQESISDTVPTPEHQDVLPIASAKMIEVEQNEALKPKEQLPMDEPAANIPIVEESMAEAPTAEEPVYDQWGIDMSTTEEPVIEERLLCQEPVSDKLDTDKSVVEEPTIEAPIMEGLTVDERATQEPAFQESVVEAPVVEELAVQESTAQESVAEASIVENIPVQDRVVEEPSTQEPVVEEPSVEESIVEKSAMKSTVDEPVPEPVPKKSKKSKKAKRNSSVIEDEPAQSSDAIPSSGVEDGALNQDNPVNVSQSAVQEETGTTSKASDLSVPLTTDQEIPSEVPAAALPSAPIDQSQTGQDGHNEARSLQPVDETTHPTEPITSDTNPVEPEASTAPESERPLDAPAPEEQSEPTTTSKSKKDKKKKKRDSQLLVDQEVDSRSGAEPAAAAPTLPAEVQSPTYLSTPAEPPLEQPPTDGEANAEVTEKVLSTNTEGDKIVESNPLGDKPSLQEPAERIADESVAVQMSEDNDPIVAPPPDESNGDHVSSSTSDKKAKKDKEKKKKQGNLADDEASTPSAEPAQPTAGRQEAHDLSFPTELDTYITTSAPPKSDDNPREQVADVDNSSGLPSSKETKKDKKKKKRISLIGLEISSEPQPEPDPQPEPTQNAPDSEDQEKLELPVDIEKLTAEEPSKTEDSQDISSLATSRKSKKKKKKATVKDEELPVEEPKDFAILASGEREQTDASAAIPIKNAERGMPTEDQPKDIDADTMHDESIPQNDSTSKGHNPQKTEDDIMDKELSKDNVILKVEGVPCHEDTSQGETVAMEQSNPKGESTPQDQPPQESEDTNKDITSLEVNSTTDSLPLDESVPTKKSKKNKKKKKQSISQVEDVLRDIPAPDANSSAIVGLVDTAEDQAPTTIATPQNEIDLISPVLDEKTISRDGEVSAEQPANEPVAMKNFPTAEPVAPEPSNDNSLVDPTPAEAEGKVIPFSSEVPEENQAGDLAASTDDPTMNEPDTSQLSNEDSSVQSTSTKKSKKDKKKKKQAALREDDDSQQVPLKDDTPEPQESLVQLEPSQKDMPQGSPLLEDLLKQEQPKERLLQARHSDEESQLGQAALNSEGSRPTEVPVEVVADVSSEFAPITQLGDPAQGEEAQSGDPPNDEVLDLKPTKKSKKDKKKKKKVSASDHEASLQEEQAQPEEGQPLAVAESVPEFELPTDGEAPVVGTIDEAKDNDPAPLTPTQKNKDRNLQTSPETEPIQDPVETSVNVAQLDRSNAGEPVETYPPDTSEKLDTIEPTSADKDNKDGESSVQPGLSQESDFSQKPLGEPSQSGGPLEPAPSGKSKKKKKKRANTLEVEPEPKVETKELAAGPAETLELTGHETSIPPDGEPISQDNKAPHRDAATDASNNIGASIPALDTTSKEVVDSSMKLDEAMEMNTEPKLSEAQTEPVTESATQLTLPEDQQITTQTLENEQIGEVGLGTAPAIGSGDSPPLQGPETVQLEEATPPVGDGMETAPSKKSKKDKKKKKRASQVSWEPGPEAEIEDLPEQQQSERTFDEQPTTNNSTEMGNSGEAVEDPFPKFESDKNSEEKKRQSRMEWEPEPKSAITIEEAKSLPSTQQGQHDDMLLDHQSLAGDAETSLKHSTDLDDTFLETTSSKKSKKKKKKPSRLDEDAKTTTLVTSETTIGSLLVEGAVIDKDTLPAAATGLVQVEANTAILPSEVDFESRQDKRNVKRQSIAEIHEPKPDAGQNSGYNLTTTDNIPVQTVLVAAEEQIPVENALDNLEQPRVPFEQDPAQKKSDHLPADEIQPPVIHPQDEGGLSQRQTTAPETAEDGSLNIDPSHDNLPDGQDETIPPGIVEENWGEKPEVAQVEEAKGKTDPSRDIPQEHSEPMTQMSKKESRKAKKAQALGVSDSASNVNPSADLQSWDWSNIDNETQPEAPRPATDTVPEDLPQAESPAAAQLSQDTEPATLPEQKEEPTIDHVNSAQPVLGKSLPKTQSHIRLEPQLQPKPDKAELQLQSKLQSNPDITPLSDFGPQAESEEFPIVQKKSKKDKRKGKEISQSVPRQVSEGQNLQTQDLERDNEPRAVTLEPISQEAQTGDSQDDKRSLSGKKSKKDRKRSKSLVGETLSVPETTFDSSQNVTTPQQTSPPDEGENLEQRVPSLVEEPIQPQNQVAVPNEEVVEKPAIVMDIPEPGQLVAPEQRPQPPLPGNQVRFVVDMSPAQLSSHIEHIHPLDQSTQPNKKPRTHIADDNTMLIEPLCAVVPDLSAPVSEASKTQSIDATARHAPSVVKESTEQGQGEIPEPMAEGQTVLDVEPDFMNIDDRPAVSDERGNKDSVLVQEDFESVPEQPFTKRSEKKKKKWKQHVGEDQSAGAAAVIGAGVGVVEITEQPGDSREKAKKKSKNTDKKIENDETSERKTLDGESRLGNEPSDFGAGPSTEGEQQTSETPRNAADAVTRQDVGQLTQQGHTNIVDDTTECPTRSLKLVPEPLKPFTVDEASTPRKDTSIVGSRDDWDLKTPEQTEPRHQAPLHVEARDGHEEPSLPPLPPPRTPSALDYSRGLAPVEEETREDLEKELQSSFEDKVHMKIEANRDSGFVTDSPNPQHHSPGLDEAGQRDSSVHMRNWTAVTTSGPSEEKVSSKADNARAAPDGTGQDDGSPQTPQPHERRSRRSLFDNETPKLSTPMQSREWDRGNTPEKSGEDEPLKRTTTTPSTLRGTKYQDLASSRDAGAALQRQYTPQHQTPRSVSDNTNAGDVAKRESTPQRSVSNTGVSRLRTPELSKFRPESPGSHSVHSVRSIRSLRSSGANTPPLLRRVDRRMSGDLRSLSSLSHNTSTPSLHSSTAATRNKDKDADRDTARDAPSDRHAPPSTITPIANEGRVRAKDMTDVYDGYGEGRIGSPRSPTRPPSMRRRQSMQVLELEARVEQLLAENRALADARAQAEQSLSYRNTSAITDRDAEIESLKASLQWLQNEVTRLTEVNEGLQSANSLLALQHNEKYTRLESQHTTATRELEEHRGAKDQYVQTLQAKDAEIQELRNQLEATKEQIREMKQQILATKPPDADFLRLKDEDHFDHRCQQLCSHVQQWVLRFSKFSDMRACRLTSEINDEKIIDRLDNTILDGSDVDDYLSDRVARRDIFMSMTMNMIWEFVFTRYLFGMDREQRQKLKSLEKILTDVGPPHAVRQWRAITLTLLSRRPAFGDQRNQDTEAVVQAILQTLSMILPPPSNLESQIQSQLRRVMREAVDLSIEMRTQRAEFMMLPPLQPEYDANGELTQTVTFNSALMHERSGDSTTNDEAYEAQGAVVRCVLFPLVVKKGDDNGIGDDEIVVSPAQVLVAKPRRSTIRMVTPSSDTGGASLLNYGAPSNLSVTMPDAPLTPEYT